MKRAQRSKSAAPLKGLPADVLRYLLQEFETNGRGSDELQSGYVGPRMDAMLSEFALDDAFSRVDYDLAIKELEELSLIKTGPIKMYDNPPDSGVFIFASFSARDYLYLTEEGYRESRKTPPVPRLSSRPTQTVHFSGNFYQSPVGVGGVVSQQINFDVSNENDAVSYLTELLSKAGLPVEAVTKTELGNLVSAANAGNMAAAKPIFQRVFGAVEESIKQLAYGVITAIITKQMGMS